MHTTTQTPTIAITAKVIVATAAAFGAFGNTIAPPRPRHVRTLQLINTYY